MIVQTRIPLWQQVQWIFSIVLLLMGISAHASQVNLSLVDAKTQAPLDGQRIDVYVVEGDGQKWAAKQTTDAQGNAQFTLEGLGAGTNYIAYTRVFNEYRVAQPLTNSGQLTWAVGALQVQVKDGSQSSHPPLANTRIDINVRQSDGKYKWFSAATTDNQGQLRIDLPGLGSGEVYILKGKSQVTGRHKSSSEITNTSDFTFIVGNPPLRVQLSDAHSGDNLANIEVTAYEKLLDGSSKWADRLTTDDQGRVDFDLDGLGSGRTYYLKTKVYNNYWAYSEALTQPTSLNWPIGSFVARVLDGSQSGHPPLGDTNVTIQKRNEDGNFKWFSSALSDSNGTLRLNLPDLGEGAVYRLSVKSVTNNQTKYSNPIENLNPVDFIVGNLALTTTLKDAETGALLSDVKISAYEVLADGSQKWANQQVTDASGIAHFDLPGLGSGRKYRLYTKVFSDFKANTAIIAEPGNFPWSIGTVRISVLNGNVSPATALSEQKVIIEQQSDGKFSWYRQLNTDSEGRIKVDLPELGSGTQYRIKTKSLADGQYKYSNPITGPGDHQFIVGSTPLQITLVDDQTGTALTDLPVTVYEVLSDGSTKWTIQRNSDAQGTVTFDLNGLGENRSYRLKAKAFNNYSYYSPVYTEAKSETLRLGKVRVAVSDGSQDNHPPLTDTAVTISKQKPDGKFGWFANATTDQQGQLKLDLPELDNGAVYRLSTKSLVADSTKYSDEITANGSYQFVVGNPAVTVHLFNALTGTSLSQQKVTAYELMADGSKVWRKAGDTDSNGRLTYDLDGLEDGRRYVLKTAPYNGGSVYSAEIPGYGNFDFPVGALPVTLVDKDTAAVLANRKITAYQILPEGKLNWYKQSETDTQGRIIFDLEGLAMGESFVFKSYNPFGENKSYYSGVIRAEGEYRFEIQKGETDKPDLVFPEVAITSPTAQSEVPARGFVLRGTASDNELLSSVEITINSAGKPAFTGTAEFEPQTGEWQYFVTEAQLTPENITDIRVVALDGVSNASEAQARYTVAEVLADLTPPEITITSHQDNDSIKKTGVTLQGNATDDVGIQSLFATVVDPVQGRIVDNKALAFDLDNGHFELVLLNGQLTVDAQIEVTLSATDDSGKTTNLTQHYRVIAAPNEPLQMANRLTFGMTPDLLAHLEAVGPDIFLDEQLNPDRIDNAVFDMLIAGSNPQTEDELKWHTLQYMLFSERQLQEVLTQFWDNHFNTALSRHGEVAYEVAENNGFRQHALGQFRDLLEVSAKSPAMILYLNNAENVKSAPNENYARELMELHTLGVDGGYTSTDVAEVARAFTGWHVQADRFFFNAGEHDEQPKTVLGQSLTQGGLADGEEVLDILASHPATARFICTKLAQLLITDNPPESLVSSCQSDFLASGGNIASVVEGLIHSPLFASNEQFRNKVKTPLEMVTTLVRNFTANVDPIAMDRGMRAMGMNLFANQVPTGWSELGEDWINSNLMLQRARFVNQVAYNTNPQNGIYIDIRGHMQVAGMTSAEAIVAYLFDLAFAGDYSETEFAIGVNILNENGTEFDLNAPDAELRLRSLLGHVLSFPGYQFQ